METYLGHRRAGFENFRHSLHHTITHCNTMQHSGNVPGTPKGGLRVFRGRGDFESRWGLEGGSRSEQIQTGGPCRCTCRHVAAHFAGVSVLQCVAVCCSVVWCSALKCTRQHVAAYFAGVSVLQCVAVLYGAVSCSVLQCTRQHVAAYCAGLSVLHAPCHT